MDNNLQQQAILVNNLLALLQQQFHAPVKRLETHISTILLVAEQAYKIKKPVNFGFLDFSSLQKRKFYCDEELRLNTRLAPQLYQQVIPVTGSPENPQINGQGQAIEYMVQMKRFHQADLLDHLLKTGQLRDEHIDKLADVIASFHKSIPATDNANNFGNPDSIKSACQQNFDQVRRLLDQVGAELDATLTDLESWSQRQFKQLETQFIARLHEGFVRECHGDMHLGNITMVDNHITIFDGIEFNPVFRWIDVISELAFISMDLEFHNHSDYASRLVNRYLEQTGDYQGLQLLRYYQVYRAMVRAKVTALRLSQMDSEADDYQSQLILLKKYIQLARLYTLDKKPCLMITHGLSGSGKSHVSAIILEKTAAIRIRSDVERMRLYPEKNSRYSSEATQKTYQYLHDLGNVILQAGFHVVIDATYLNQYFRQQAKALADSQDAAFLIIDLQADSQELEKRIRQRSSGGTDASEATIKILHQQRATEEPLTDQEQALAIVITPADNMEKIEKALASFLVKCPTPG